MQNSVNGENVTNAENEHFPGKIQTFNREENQFTFRCDNGVTLMVTVLTNKIIRFRYATTGIFQKDFSYAIDPNFGYQIGKDVAVF